jgi:hypothetical protein
MIEYQLPLVLNGRPPSGLSADRQRVHSCRPRIVAAGSRVPGSIFGSVPIPPQGPRPLARSATFRGHRSNGTTDRNGRTAIRYLTLTVLVLAYALISSPGFAQTCCPAGCAPEANRCVTTGAVWTSCIPIACAEGSRTRRSSAESSRSTHEYQKSAVLARPLRTARTYVPPHQIPSHCPLISPTKAQVDEATNECVNALTQSAQLRDCIFEDDAGRAEGQRTGLGCADRQRALAKQCLKRCANYASDTTHLVCTGSYPNTLWHISFGDISGDTGNSARVDRCGPPLKSLLAGGGK